MLLFPFFENIEDRRFLIIGGGRIAKQKLSVLLRFTDRITLVAEDFAPEGESLKVAEESSGPVLMRKRFSPEDLDLGDYIVAATSDRALNEEISRLAREKKKPVNVVDDAELCTFFFPALIRKGGLVVGVSTSGKSPAYAGHLRREIEALVPDHIEEILDTLESCRSWLPEILPAQRERGQFLKELMQQLLEEAEAPRESEPRKSAYREPELREMAKKFQKRRGQP